MIPKKYLDTLGKITKFLITVFINLFEFLNYNLFFSFIIPFKLSQKFGDCTVVQNCFCVGGTGVV